MQTPDQLSQFQSAASVYAPSTRQYNEFDDDGIDISQEINQDYNDEYRNDNGDIETENENDIYLMTYDQLSHTHNLSSNQGETDSFMYQNGFNG